MQRLSVGVQSFDDGLLKQMDRYDKYGCGQEILERIQDASPYFVSMNADMIFNFPAQTEDNPDQRYRARHRERLHADHVLSVDGFTVGRAAAWLSTVGKVDTPASRSSTRSSANC